METSGKLHLVDLAGSECAKTAGNENPVKERERRNINQSLLTLGAPQFRFWSLFIHSGWTKVK